MTFHAPGLVGRESDLERLVTELDRTTAGQGRIVLLCGEAGIGKSRLAEEVATAANEREFSVVWGRCWEAGGAPAYWPWIQILRGLMRERPAQDASRWLRGRAAELVQIVPEVAQIVDELRPLPGLEADQARFRLLDAVWGAIADAAVARPVAVILEDLHVADPSTLAVLELLVGQVRGSRVLVLGTARGLESEPTLGRIARQAEVVPLSRFDLAQVARYLAEATTAAPSSAAVKAIHAKTEGNPLFLAEVSRLLSGQGGVERAAELGVTVPGSIKQVVGERLAGLPDRTRTVVDVGAVLGREFDRTVLTSVTQADAATLDRALAEATEASVLESLGPERVRFTHILLREAVYAQLDPDERTRLHASAARALAVGASEVAWSEVASHWLVAGPTHTDETVEACRRAAEDALRRLAYAEAAQWFERALVTAGEDAPGRGDLLLGLADARIRSGDAEAGQRACEQAAGLARRDQDASLLARAALQAGTLFRFAHVDAGLVQLLEEAQAMLPEHDAPLRARVMARLAAALQPAVEAEVPFRLAREAIAMARRLDDQPTLLATIRSACSALMDLAHPDERRALNREYVALALRLGDDAEAFRGNARLVFDCYELVDLAGAYAAIEACDALAGTLDHPFFAWRVAAMRAMRAIREGRYAEAEEHAARARRLGEHAGDPNVEPTLVLQRIGLLRLQARSQELRALLPRLSTLFADSSAVPVHRVLVASELARMGHADQARAHLHPGDLEAVIGAGDRSVFMGLATYCLATGETGLVRQMMDALQPFRDLLASGGALEMLWEEPIQLSLARLHLALGEHEAADACFERGIALARETGARPHEAWAAVARGRALRDRPGAGADALARARASLERACELGRELGTPALVEIAEQELASIDDRGGRVPDSGRARFSMARNGDGWTIEHAGGSFRLRDTKGLALLSRLVAEPGRELHVLDLVEPAAGREVDRGDAGEMLDRSARRAYEHRVEDLREELAEAESFHDPARAERARAELDAIAAELARAVGIGGRVRRSGSAAERARVNVQRRLRDAIRRIHQQDTGLGRHLERSVKTGAYCCYEPE